MTEVTARKELSIKSSVQKRETSNTRLTKKYLD